MKKAKTLMFALLIGVGAMAQTRDLGNGMTEVISNDGKHYELKQSLSSPNGGTCEIVFSGDLLNGVRNGAWKGRVAYRNYAINETICKNGEITISRSYKNGILDGLYSYSESVRYFKIIKDAQNNTITYQTTKNPADDKCSTTGSFVNGKLNGYWNFSGKIKASCNFENGICNGRWSVEDSPNGKTYSYSFDKGYLINYTEPSQGGKQKILSYDNATNMAGLPNQKVVDFTKSFDEIDYLLSGGFFKDWFLKYPQGSSDESMKASYKTADFDNHFKEKISESVINSRSKLQDRKNAGVKETNKGVISF